jgi:hypothetical protein
MADKANDSHENSQPTEGAKIRCSNQNNWPSKTYFECENEFATRISSFPDGQIFTTAPLALTNDHFVNRAIAGILDGLDGFPGRPELAFDQFYRSIDVSMSRIGAPKLVKDLKDKNEETWSPVFENLTAVAPRQTGEYIARRILECQTRKIHAHERKLLARAERSFGGDKFKAINKKYLVAAAEPNQNFELREKNGIYDCGGLIYLMLRQSGTLRKKHDGDVLDLSIKENLLSWDKKLHILIDSCLTTYRHERAHGSAFSPFKSGKASMKTYAHAYYCAIIAYAALLSLISLHSEDILKDEDIIIWSEKISKNYRDFFGMDLES